MAEGGGKKARCAFFNRLLVSGVARSCQITRQKSGIDLPRQELCVLQYTHQHRDVGMHPLNRERFQRYEYAADGLLTSSAATYHFGE